MADYACILQEGQTPESKRAELAEGLKRIGREMLGDSPQGAEIRWIPVPQGFGFTAGSPSTSSIVVRSVPGGFPEDRREAFMTKVCDLWTDVTGCTTNEIVVTALDGALPI
jgi:hypothetical protein